MKKYAYFVVRLSLQIAFGLPVKHYYRTTEFPRELLESHVQALEIRIGITMSPYYDVAKTFGASYLQDKFTRCSS